MQEQKTKYNAEELCKKIDKLWENRSLLSFFIHEPLGSGAKKLLDDLKEKLRSYDPDNIDTKLNVIGLINALENCKASLKIFVKFEEFFNKLEKIILNNRLAITEFQKMSETERVKDEIEINQYSGFRLTKLPKKEDYSDYYENGFKPFDFRNK